MIKTQNHVKVEANRCPFCRDDVQAEDSVVCQDCLTRHHEPCWQEAGRCSSCSSDTLMRAEAPPDRQITDEDVTQLLRQAHYKDSEIEAYWGSRQQPVMAESCSWNNCHRSGPYQSALGGQAMCAQHAQFNHTAIKLTAMVAALFFAGVTIFLSVLAFANEEFFLLTPGLLSLLAAFGFSVLSTRIPKAPERIED